MKLPEYLNESVIKFNDLKVGDIVHWRVMEKDGYVKYTGKVKEIKNKNNITVELQKIANKETKMKIVTLPVKDLRTN